jgi:hypothetical protein
MRLIGRQWKGREALSLPVLMVERVDLKIIFLFTFKELN